MNFFNRHFLLRIIIPALFISGVMLSCEESTTSQRDNDADTTKHSISCPLPISDPVPKMVVYSPAKGAKLKLGEVTTLRWAYNYDLYQDNKIDISIDGGETWQTIQFNNTDSLSSDRYACDSTSWTVGKGIASGPHANVYIRVVSYFDETYLGISDSFEIIE